MSLTRSLPFWVTAAFASYFTEDGDLVNIHGMRMRGQPAIAGIYDMLFRGVFRSSRLEPEVSGSLLPSHPPTAAGRIGST